MLLQALRVEIEMKNLNLQVTSLVQKGVGTLFPRVPTPLHPCLHHYNCLLFIIIPPVTDVHVMLKKIECERVWPTKRSQGKTEGHLYLSIK